MFPAERTLWIVGQARALGFELCGVAPVEALAELERMAEWLERGYAGKMDYLHDPRRRDPRRVLECARNVIVCALNYNTPPPYSTEVPAAPAEAGEGAFSGPRGWISRYAWGEDYHEVLGRKLEALLARMQRNFREPFVARAYADTGPVVERVAAKCAGLGWLAKNTCVINEHLGSWLFLGVILTDLDLAPTLAPGEPPPPDLCGNCRLCLDACPTGAIVEPYQLDARRCISYLTIELRGAIPREFRSPMGRMVFGCDICQDVCPWNRKAPAASLAAFLPRKFAPQEKEQISDDAAALVTGIETQTADAAPEPQSLLSPSLEWLASLTEEEFRRVFRRSAVKRTKWRGLVRNACVALGNSGVTPESPRYPRIANLLERLAASEDAIIAEHARWALERFRSSR